MTTGFIVLELADSGEQSRSLLLELSKTEFTDFPIVGCPNPTKTVAITISFPILETINVFFGLSGIMAKSNQS